MQSYLWMNTGIGIKNLFILSVLFVGCAFGSTSSNEVNRFLEKFSQRLQASQGLTFKGVGLSFPDNHLNLIDVGFRYERCVDLSTARKLVVEVTEEFVSAYRTDPSLAKYLPIVQNSREGVIVRLSFERDCDTDSHKVAFAFFNRNRIIYYRAVNKAGGLEEIFVEPYPEAYEKVMGTPLPR
jgi:hypothetical protein